VEQEFKIARKSEIAVSTVPKVRIGTGVIAGLRIPLEANRRLIRSNKSVMHTFAETIVFVPDRYRKLT